MNMVRMVLTLALISAAAAFALSAANMATADKIAAAAEAKAARAVQKIFPDCTSPEKTEARTPTGEAIAVYKCPGNRVSFTFSTTSDKSIPRAYGGPVRVMVGVDGKGEIAGVQVLAQSETPGLGAKIADESFLQQFKGMSVKSNWKTKKEDPSGGVDTISGATISTRAVAGLLAHALTFFHATVAVDLDAERAPEPAVPPAPGGHRHGPSCGGGGHQHGPSCGGGGHQHGPSCGGGHQSPPGSPQKVRPPRERINPRAVSGFRPEFEGARKVVTDEVKRKRDHARAVGGEIEGRPVPSDRHESEGGQP